MSILHDKLPLQTPNLTAQNIDKIAALFPNCITEMLDEEKSTPTTRFTSAASTLNC